MGGVVFALMAVVIGLTLRLSQGPLSLDGVSDFLKRSVEERFGGDYAMSMGSVVLEQTSQGPSIRVVDVRLADRAGRDVIASPKAEIGFDPVSLAMGRPALRRLAFIGPELRVAIGHDPNVAATATDAAGADGATAGLLGLFSGSSAIGALREVAVESGTLVLRDNRDGATVVYDDVSFELEGDGAGKTLRISARGPHGPVSASGSVTPGPDGGRRVVISPDRVALGDALAPVVARSLSLAPTATLSGRIATDLDAQGRFLRGEARLTLGAARWTPPEAPKPLFSTDQITIDVASDAATGITRVREASLRAGATRIALSGEVTTQADGARSFRLTGSDGALAPARASDAPQRLAAIAMEGSAPASLDGVRIERLFLAGPDLDVDLDGSFFAQGELSGLRLRLASRPTNVGAVLALWPVFISPELRDYLVERLLAGRIEALALSLALSPSQLGDAIANRPLPDKAFALSVDVTGAQAAVIDGIPPLIDGKVGAVATGRTATVTIDAATAPLAQGRVLTISEGRVFVADTAQKIPHGQIAFLVKGAAEAFADLLSRPFLSEFAAIDFPPTDVKGSGEARVSLAMPFRDGLTADDLKSRVNGALTGLTIENFAGKESLENARIEFSLDRQALSLRGEGRFLGVPTQIDVKRPDLKQPVEARLALTLDDAARARQGFGGREIAGSVGVRISTRGDGQAAFELDLSRTTIDGLVPGWRKPSGQAARATFRVEETREGVTVEDLKVVAGPMALSGRANLSRDGGLISARLDQFRLSSGDDARVEIERAGAGFKVTARGGAIDARPLIRSALGSPREPAKDTGKDIEIDARFATATGFGGEALTGFELKLARRGGETRQFALGGRVGRGTVSGVIARADADGDALVIETTDAGALLRFADLYRRMLRGTMSVRLTGRGEALDGLVIVRDFRLKDEPALAQVASGAVASSQDRTDANAAEIARARANEVAFTKMRVDFAKVGTRFDVREAVMWGPQIGATISGTVDYARDRINMTGTFVPAYGLNNVFSQVPLFGPLLGGGANEGLFAVSFRVTGPANAPEVAISPLSAIAPGIFRKLFEFRDQRTDALAPPASTAVR